MILIILVSLLWQACALSLPSASFNSMRSLGHPSQIASVFKIGTVLQSPEEEIAATTKVIAFSPEKIVLLKLIVDKMNSVTPRSLDVHPNLLQEPLEKDPNKPHPYVLRILLRKVMPMNQSANNYALEFAENKHIEVDLENVFRTDKFSVFMMVQITDSKVIELRKDPRVSLCTLECSQSANQTVRSTSSSSQWELS